MAWSAFLVLEHESELVTTKDVQDALNQYELLPEAILEDDEYSWTTETQATYLRKVLELLSIHGFVTARLGSFVFVSG